MAKLEEMKVGEVYKSEHGDLKEILFVDDKSCYTQWERAFVRSAYSPSDVKSWTLVKPERELWFWRVKLGDIGWKMIGSMLCEEGVDSKGEEFRNDWHSLEKEKLTALGSVKVEG